MCLPGKEGKDGMKEKQIITIRYEIGTPGLEVGEKLARHYGIPFYTNEVMADMLSDPAHEEYFRKSGTTEGVDKRYGGIYFFENVDGARYSSRNNIMFEEQSELTRELAQKGSAVFVSRCVDSVLADFDLISVFIGSEIEYRIRQIMIDENIDYKTARNMVREIDKGRKTYYHYFTDKTWGQREDYDLCIDPKKLTVDSIVEVIRAFADGCN